MFTDYPSKKQAEEQAEEYAEPLDRLINPDDIDADADTWSDIDRDLLEQEVWESTSIIRTEHSAMRHLIQDHAFRLWTESLIRQPRDVIDDDISDEELIHEYSVWPYDMDKWECYEIAHRVFETPDREIHPEYIDEAEEAVLSGLFYGSMPEGIEA